MNNVWTISSGPGQQVIAGQDLVFNGSDPIALPSGLISAATTLTVNVAFSTTSDGVILGYQDAAARHRARATSCRPCMSAPTAISTAGSNGFGTFQSSAPVNDGQTHDVVLSINGSTMTVTIDGTQVAQISGSNNSLDMTYDQLGTGYGDTSPDAPTSGDFPFTGTISSLTITQGTALAGYVAPSSSSVNQITFTPPAAGTYTVGLSSTNSSGSSTSTSQTLAATDVAPTPTISGLPASGAVNQTYTLVGSVTDPVPSNTAAGFNDVWSVSAGPGQQAVAASNLVFNGSNPIALPSGLIHNATSLDDQRDLPDHRRRRHPRLPGPAAGLDTGRTTCRSSTSAPTAISTLSSATAPPSRSKAPRKVNDGQLHTVTIQWNGSVLSYTLDSKTSGTISNFTPEMLDMTVRRSWVRGTQAS